MSDSEKQSILGKLVMDHQKAKETVRLLELHLASIGSSLIAIGQNLRDGNLSVLGPNLAMFQEEAVDLSGVKAKVKELREAQTRLAELSSAMKEFGLDR